MMRHTSKSGGQNLKASPSHASEPSEPCIPTFLFTQTHHDQRVSHPLLHPMLTTKIISSHLLTTTSSLRLPLPPHPPHLRLLPPSPTRLPTRRALKPLPAPRYPHRRRHPRHLRPRLPRWPRRGAHKPSFRAGSRLRPISRLSVRVRGAGGSGGRRGGVCGYGV